MRLTHQGHVTLAVTRPFRKCVSIFWVSSFFFFFFSARQTELFFANWMTRRYDAMLQNVHKSKVGRRKTAAPASINVGVVNFL